MSLLVSSQFGTSNCGVFDEADGKGPETLLRGKMEIARSVESDRYIFFLYNDLFGSPEASFISKNFLKKYYSSYHIESCDTRMEH